MPKLNVMILVLVAAIPLPPTINSQSLQWPTRAWSESSPEAQGLSSDRLQRLDEYIRDQKAVTTSVVVVRNGFIVKEAYYRGGTEALWDVFSVAKGVISFAVGVAIQRGEIKAVDQYIFDLMPSVYDDLSQKLARKITIQHLLTMTSGADPSMSTGIGKIDVSTLFQLPFFSKPGEKFFYNELNTNILSMLITEKSGILAAEYAKRHIFDFLGISNFKWRTYEGYTIGSSDLRLTTRDMAKVGYLALQQGCWDGRQVVPSLWISEATSAKAVTGREYDGRPLDYGYGWWTFDVGGFPAFAAIGFGGQVICVVPSLQLVVAMTGDKGDGPARFDVVRDVIIPAIAVK